MKKFYLMFVLAALMMAFTAQAQQIAVVNGGTTHVYQTLKDAIDHADDGSVIYLPGGGFPISDEVKITKKVTIIGIGHKAKGDNADGNTIIGGNLFFNQGSSGSSVMGCYIGGDVIIGEDNSSVNKVTIKKCNINSIQVKNSTCSETAVNQNYIRTHSYFNGGSGNISNNILFTIMGVDGGSILNNIVTGYRKVGDYNEYAVDVNNCVISYNVVLFKTWLSGWTYNIAGANIRGGNNLGTDNMVFGANSDWGDNPINLTDVDFNNLFKNFNGGTISPLSDFHFQDDYKEYETRVGIYAGDGFSEGGVPPVPYIKAKRIAEQTDAAGMLKVQIRVNAGE